MSTDELSQLIHLGRNGLTAGVFSFPEPLLKQLRITLRKNLPVEVDKCEIAEDRQLTVEEENVHALTPILELPGSAPLVVPLLLRLPFCLRRIHAASFWSIWLKFPGWLGIMTDLLTWDRELVLNFLGDRFQRDIFPRLSPTSFPARAILRLICSDFQVLLNCPAGEDLLFKFK